jgi:hypothetical protein
MTPEIKLMDLFLKDSRDVDTIDPRERNLRVLHDFVAMSLASGFTNTSSFWVR